MRIDRRRFLLRSGLGAAGTLAALSGAGEAGAATTGAPTAGAAGDATLGPVPFQGPHQAGILTPAPPAAAFVALDVTAGNRSALASLLRTITARARFLTAGGVPPSTPAGSPPADSGTLGPHVPPDALTVTLGVSSTLFDDRFGLGPRRPIRLTAMQPFPNDGLTPEWLGGDLMLQLCAGSSDTVLHALRDITRHTAGAMAVRWRMDGFLSPPRPSGVARNHFGFMDGIANPPVHDRAVADKLLWVVKGHGEPSWAVGGSYQVVRLIRMFTDLFDAVPLARQEAIFGRHRSSGAPLGQAESTDVPDYARDPHGRVVPLTAHMRLANPRTARTASTRILRRGYNYDVGVDADGRLNMGLVFACYQQDVIRQFEATQVRLVDEPLAAYVRPFGGGYFFALPGVRHAKDWLGRGLLAS
ncbi:MAG TPA: Dyp-type peroxidase [Acidimicrobiales bacterium]|nr:Dyp-type peroxidase [Acidimicrobiales bacterium]